MKTKKLDHLSEIYKEYDDFLIDLWGVMHNGIKLNASAVEAINKLESKGKNILAVVGAAHVPGMVKAIESNLPIDREPINQIPPPSLFKKSLKWLIPSLIMLAFFWGFKNKRYPFELSAIAR